MSIGTSLDAKVAFKLCVTEFFLLVGYHAFAVFSKNQYYTKSLLRFGKRSNEIAPIKIPSNIA